MAEFFVRFLIGGLFVSFFALLGDLFEPKSFAGLFGAAPSIALATLSLTVAKQGPIYAAIEARSMIAGALAFFIYASLVSWLLRRHQARAIVASSFSLLPWFATAFILWFVCLR
jgi:ABC-type multidrug transport system permease subunit